MRAPRQRWRTLPADGQMEFADTEDEVRALARAKAQSLGTDVGVELWSELHSQDALNQGWASVGVERYAPSDPIRKHIEAICKDAGLGVMVQVYEIIMDREAVPGRTILKLDAGDVEEHYLAILAPAIDDIEKELQ